MTQQKVIVEDWLTLSWSRPIKSDLQKPISFVAAQLDRYINT